MTTEDFPEFRNVTCHRWRGGWEVLLLLLLLLLRVPIVVIIVTTTIENYIAIIPPSLTKIIILLGLPQIYLSFVA